MAKSPAQELEQAMPKLMDSVVHAVAILTLHLTGKHRLTPDQVRHWTTVLTHFIEAVDALPPTQ